MIKRTQRLPGRFVVSLLPIITLGSCSSQPTDGSSERVAVQSESITYCDGSGDDPRTVLSSGFSSPWNSIGFIDDGCTATVIDSEHILTAAHCVVSVVEVPGFYDAGEWLKGPGGRKLRFYPAYHPDNASYPYVEIDRVVVGQRTEHAWPLQHALEWAIAHVTPSLNTIAYPARPIRDLLVDDTTVSNAGYAREPFEFCPPGALPYGNCSDCG